MRPPHLSKDCECPDHDGPHWLHENFVLERTNLAAFQSAIDAEDDLGVAAGMFFWAEWRRKSELLYQAKIRGIEEIPSDLVPPPPPMLRYPCLPDGSPHPVIEELARLMHWDLSVSIRDKLIQRRLFSDLP